jgi:hypothetical protein
MFLLLVLIIDSIMSSVEAVLAIIQLLDTNHFDLDFGMPRCCKRFSNWIMPELLYNRCCRTSL